MKAKDKKSVKKNEFRYNKKTGHPAYVFKRTGHDYDFIGITHAKKTQGVKNIKLTKSPNPANKSATFILANPGRQRTTTFNKREKGWSFAKSDFEKVNSVKKRPIKKQPAERLSNGRTARRGLNGASRNYGISKLNSRDSQRSKTRIAKPRPNVKGEKRGGK